MVDQHANDRVRLIMLERRGAQEMTEQWRSTDRSFAAEREVGAV